jgi:hypothetical protein
MVRGRPPRVDHRDPLGGDRRILDKIETVVSDMALLLY